MSTKIIRTPYPGLKHEAQVYPVQKHVIQYLYYVVNGTHKYNAFSILANPLRMVYSTVNIGVQKPTKSFSAVPYFQSGTITIHAKN